MWLKALGWIADKFVWQGQNRRLGLLLPEISRLSENTAFQLHRAIEVCGPLPCIQEQWRQSWLRNPDSVDGLLSAGRLSEWLKKTDLALHFLQRCLDIEPFCISANSRIGIFLAREQQWDAAIEYLARAIDPDNPNLLCCANLGSALFMAGEETDALAVLHRAWVKSSSLDSVARALFHVAMRTANLVLAEKVVKTVLSVPPHKSGHTEEEEAGGEIVLFGGDLELWPKVAAALLACQQGDYLAARNTYEALLKDNPVAGLAGLGTLAMARGDFPQAYEHFCSAILQGNVPSAQSYFNRAKALVALTRYVDALADFEHALTIQPDYMSAKFERGLTQLRLGNWLAGWEGYEARRLCVPENLFNYFDASAEWQGESLYGKSIILVGEQGQGDVIQFVRFAKILKKKGAEVSVFCLPSLVRLVRTVPGVARVFTSGETIPPYDYWVPIMSVPYRIKLTLDALVWDGPYIRPDQANKEKWLLRLSLYSTPRIGIVWSGHDYQGQIWGQIYERRNLVFSDFEPLLRITGCTFFSLQKGRASEQLISSPLSSGVIDFSAEWKDFLDTANFLANLDLVITVDTSVAHLAGALGCPVWIMSRTDGCWRWLDRKTDSPWYPTARIFHQGVDEKWSVVIQRVAESLIVYINDKAKGTKQDVGTEQGCTAPLS